MDFDGLLNYEEQCYDKGFREGSEKGIQQGFTEGRELGIQTGYQKFLSMGILQARVQRWQQTHTDTDQAALDTLAQAVATPSLTNNLSEVEEFDRRLRLAKNKCRQLASATDSPSVNAHEQKIMYQRGADEAGAIEDMY